MQIENKWRESNQKYKDWDQEQQRCKQVYSDGVRRSIQGDNSTFNKRENFRLKNILDTSEQINRLQIMFSFFDKWDKDLTKEEQNERMELEERINNNGLNMGQETQEMIESNKKLDEFQDDLNELRCEIRNKEASINRQFVQLEKEKDHLNEERNDCVSDQVTLDLRKMQQILDQEEEIEQRYASIHLKKKLIDLQEEDLQIQFEKIRQSRIKIEQKENELISIKYSMMDKQKAIAKDIVESEQKLDRLQKEIDSNQIQLFTNDADGDETNERETQLLERERNTTLREQNIQLEIIFLKSNSSSQAQTIPNIPQKLLFHQTQLQAKYPSNKSEKFEKNLSSSGSSASFVHKQTHTNDLIEKYSQKYLNQPEQMQSKAEHKDRYEQERGIHQYDIQKRQERQEITRQQLEEMRKLSNSPFPEQRTKVQESNKVETLPSHTYEPNKIISQSKKLTMQEKIQEQVKFNQLQQRMGALIQRNQLERSQDARKNEEINQIILKQETDNAENIQESIEQENKYSLI